MPGTYHLSQPANQQVAFDKFQYSAADKSKLQHSPRSIRKKTQSFICALKISSDCLLVPTNHLRFLGKYKNRCKRVKDTQQEYPRFIIAG